MMVFFKDCFMVIFFKNGIVCRLEGSIMYVFSSLLELWKIIFLVLILLICYFKFFEICWFFGLKKICILIGNDVKEIVIYDLYIDFNLSNFMFGYVFFDGMFVVLDWDKECIFFIGSLGCIVRRKYIYFNIKFGLIFLDLNFKFYVCDFYKSVIVIIV